DVTDTKELQGRKLKSFLAPRLSTPDIKAAPQAGPPHTISNRGQLEREVVVGLFERSRKILEVSSARRRRPCLRTSRRRSSAPSRALTIKIARRGATAAQHQELAHIDLGAVASLVLLVLPLTVLDPTLDVNLVALLTVLLDNVG